MASRTRDGAAIVGQPFWPWATLARAITSSGRMRGGKLTERDVNAMVKRMAAKAGINEVSSPHWLRHAHGSHAIDRGASLPEVQEATLGHANVSTTSGYLHARRGLLSFTLGARHSRPQPKLPIGNDVD
jgi:site-specific recombinase XerC